MKNILRTTLAAAFVGLVFSSAQAQSDRSDNAVYAAPITWTFYKIPSQNLMISLPKLPIVRERNDPCSQIEGARYYAYAREAVYEFQWQAKSSIPFPSSCHEKTSFSKKAYSNRLEALRRDQAYVESEETVFGTKAKVFRRETPYGVTTRWLIWDVDRWLEMGVSRRKDAGADETRFIRGITLATPQAIDMKGGASQILGDDDVQEKILSAEEKITEPLVILRKPIPKYTEEGRLSNVKGSVSLRASFLHNGGIGEISVLKGLPSGLTEQAIVAAKTAAFLPAKVDGKPVTVVKLLDFTFSIY